jgi:hypothetical protein
MKDKTIYIYCLTINIVLYFQYCQGKKGILMKDVLQKKGSTFFLRAAVLAMGAAVLALCIFALPAAWRAAGADEEYADIVYAFHSILLAMYAAAIPFFYALHQALKLLRYIDTNKAFSLLSVKALKVIACCGVIIGSIFAAAAPFFYIWSQRDDAPGLVVVAMMAVGASLVVAVFAAVLQRLLREAIAMKSENELTV